MIGNGDAFGVISLVGGIAVRHLPLEEFGLKNLGSPNGICGTYGCCFPPWRTCCGNLLPHFPTTKLVSCGVSGWLWRLLLWWFRQCLFHFGGGLVVSFMSVEVFFSFLLIVLGSYSINTCPTCSCRWLFKKIRNNFFKASQKRSQKMSYC